MDELIGAGVLLEREAALDAIDELLDRAQSELGGCLFIVGEAGFGKTALLDHAIAAASSRLTVRRVTAELDRRNRPLADAGLLTRPEAPATESAMLVIDDLHWADAGSIAMLELRARHAAAARAPIIAALRPSPDRALGLAQTLSDAGHASLIALRALSREASDALLASRLGDRIDHELTERVWELAAGNPSLTIAAARAMRYRGSAQQLLSRLRQVLVGTRLAGLSSTAIQCAQAVSVLGAPVRMAAVQAVAGLDDEAFAEGFDALIAADVLRPRDRLESDFSLPWLSDAIEQELEPARRRLLHERAFSFHHARDEPRAAARHVRAADLRGDQRAVNAVGEASARALADGDLDRAVELSGTVLDLAGENPAPELLIRHADTLFAASQPPAAVDFYTRALRRTDDPGIRAEVLPRAARAQAIAGRFEAAIATYDDLVELAGGLEHAPTAVILERAHAIWELEGPTAGIAAIPIFPQGARAATERELMRAARGLYLLHAGDASEAPAIKRFADAERRSIVRGTPDAGASFNAFIIHATVASHLERFVEADEVLAYAEEWVQRAGAPAAAIALRLIRCGNAVHRGRLAASLAGLDQLARELSGGQLLAPIALLIRARALIWMGQIEEARQLHAQVPDLPGAHAWFVRLLAATDAAERLLADGNPEAASDAFARIPAQSEAIGLGDPVTVPWASGAIEAAYLAKRPEQIERTVVWLEHAAARLPSRWPRLIATGGRAALAAARGDADEAERLYGEALALPSEAPLDRARIVLRYGAWLRRERQAVRARTFLAEALQIADEHGAGGLAAPARIELASAGGRRRRARSEDRLTGQEERIARLAVTGATTKEIAGRLYISTNTVQSHLSHIYAKLGVAGKQELRRRQHELGLGSEQ